MVVVFFSFFIMGDGRGRGRSAREGLKPQGQGQNQGQRPRNNKAKVKVVAKNNNVRGVKATPASQRARNQTPPQGQWPRSAKCQRARTKKKATQF